VKEERERRVVRDSKWMRIWELGMARTSVRLGDLYKQPARAGSSESPP